MFGQHNFGFSFVTGVPATPEATEGLSTKIGFIRETQCNHTDLCPTLYITDRRLI